MTRDEVMKQLESAAIFLGQAQEGCKPQSVLWNEIGKLYDEVDSLADGIAVVNDPENYYTASFTE